MATERLADRCFCNPYLSGVVRGNSLGRMSMRAWSMILLAGCGLAAAGEQSIVKTAPDAARSTATSVDRPATQPADTKPAVIDTARMKQIVRDLAIAQSTAPRPLDGSAPRQRADARDSTSQSPSGGFRRGYTNLDTDCHLFGCVAYDAQGQRLYTRWNENISGLGHGFDDNQYGDSGSCLSTNNLMSTFERCAGAAPRRNAVDATPKPRRK